ncbi:hypothetical protein F4824DRAFT_420446 [Ustulina deusta]|nr:hypothetical protein F4823DRAFT_454879 [Ustulina deusta]KAI3340410.1 hypothetical protein F4824DRAFT_420446 [Ustulina deusta]
MPHSRDRHPSVSSAGSRYSYYSNGSSYSSNMSTTTGVSIPDIPGANFAQAEGLPCEFAGYTECDLVFELDDVQNWIEHIIVDHLREILPRKAICWFCDDYIFDSKRTGDRRTNFEERMNHIRNHFLYEGKTAQDMRPDHHFNRHLRDHKLISEAGFNAVRKWDEVPQGSWILPLDATPSDWQPKDSRRELEYNNPRDERSYRNKHHKHGKSRK